MSDALSLIIQSIEQLSKTQRDALLTHLQTLERHSDLVDTEVCEIRQNVLTQTDANCCPHCLSRRFIKWGMYKQRQGFKCKGCERTFNELTGTIWHYIHQHDKFRTYLECLAQGKVLQECCIDADICMQTAFYWRHKLLQAFRKLDEQGLKGIIQADETFFLESFKGQRDLEQFLAKNRPDNYRGDRKIKKRGARATKKGINEQHICVMSATDTASSTVLKVVGKGRLTKQMVELSLAKRIRKQRVHRATLVTDRHSSYKQMVQQKKLIHQTVCASVKQRVNPQGFNLNAVNALQSRLKRWMTRFNGVASKYLQNYLYYFQAWDKVNSFKERFYLLLKQSLTHNQMFVRNCDIIRPTIL